MFGTCNGKGSTGEFYTISDNCGNTTQLYECFCNNNNYINGGTYECPDVCVNGTCVVTTTMPATTSSTTSTTIPSGDCFDVDASQYCSVSGGDTSWGEYLERVRFAGIDFTSGDNLGYLDATNQISQPVTPGNSYQLQVQLSNTGYKECVSAWFDWDKDKVFENGERINLGCCVSCNLMGSVAVPSSAQTGATMFRVVAEYYRNPTSACTNPTYNEIEDYTVCVGDSSGTISSTSSSTTSTIPSGMHNLVLSKTSDWYEAYFTYPYCASSSYCITMFDYGSSGYDYGCRLSFSGLSLVSGCTVHEAVLSLKQRYYSGDGIQTTYSYAGTSSNCDILTLSRDEIPDDPDDVIDSSGFNQTQVMRYLDVTNSVQEAADAGGSNLYLFLTGEDLNGDYSYIGYATDTPQPTLSINYTCS